jgi:hypothetical protein
MSDLIRKTNFATTPLHVNHFEDKRTLNHLQIQNIVETLIRKTNLQIFPLHVNHFEDKRTLNHHQIDDKGDNKLSKASEYGNSVDFAIMRRFKIIPFPASDKTQ